MKDLLETLQEFRLKIYGLELQVQGTTVNPHARRVRPTQAAEEGLSMSEEDFYLEARRRLEGLSRQAEPEVLILRLFKRLSSQEQLEAIKLLARWNETLVFRAIERVELLRHFSKDPPSDESSATSPST